MLEITGIDKAIADIKLLGEKHKLGVTQALKNLVMTVFEDIVIHTPQYSGNLVSNWRVEVGGAFQGASTYRKHPDYTPPGTKWKPIDYPYAAGLSPGVSDALEFNAESIDRIRWNSKIRIVNNAPYAAEVEAGMGPPRSDKEQTKFKDGADRKPLRSVNLFSGPNIPAHGVAMVAYATMKYGSLKYRDLAVQGKLR
jgi:hypothetical protein